MSNESPPCSVCGQVLIRKGRHWRHLLLAVAGSDGEEYERWTVLLPRFLCKSCGHTHVGFPDEGIIPYKHYGEMDIEEVAEALEALWENPESDEERADDREALHPFFQAPSTAYDWQGWYRGLRRQAAGVLLDGKSLMGRPKTLGSLLTSLRTGRDSWLGSLALRVYASRQRDRHILSGDIRVQVARLKAS